MNTYETKTAIQQPAFTTREDEQGIHLQVALPGVRKEDLKLSVREQVLTIEAARDNTVPADWTVHSAPPKSVTYQLNARLTPKFDGGAAKATLENGVLLLDIPVREEAKPRSISVN
jgi:HSP20 family protein